MLSPSIRLTLVHSCHTRFLFYYSNNNNGFTTKEENDTVSYSIYKGNGELSSRGLNCKAFCEFRTVYENDYLRVPYNNQK